MCVCIRTCLRSAFVMASFSAYYCMYVCVRVPCVCVCVCVRMCVCVSHSQAMQRHAQNLTSLGEHSKAVSLHTQAVQHWANKLGENDQGTIRAAMCLAQTHYQLKRYTEALCVFRRIWGPAEHALRDDTKVHMLLFEGYLWCLLAEGEAGAVQKLRSEALARALPADKVQELYSRICAESPFRF